MSSLPALFNVDYAAGGRLLLARLSLTLRPERTVILGPNGAGKSLTLRLLQGLLPPASGKIERARTALVAQRPVLLRRTVAENLDHALRIYGLPRQSRPARIADLLARGDLLALADRPARSLSGGEQQRLSLLRGLAADPVALLLDEPTAHLDPRSTARVEALLAEAALPYLLVTHDIGQARRLADRVLFLNRGVILEDTPASAFFAAPRTTEARAYLNGDLVL